MLFGLLINFCILFTFAVLSYWPFQNVTKYNFPFPKTLPYIIGILGGLAGFILMETSVELSETLRVDARHIIIVISGIFGGPIAPVVSGLIIGLSRMLMTDVFTASGLLVGSTMIFIGIVIGAFSSKYPITFKNAHYYFYYATVQTVLLITYLIFQSSGNYFHIIYFIFFSAFSFFMVLFILIELRDHFKKIRHIELLSETDYLTGLYNYRKFHELTNSLVTDSTRPFSMISIDIDHFKKVNDTHGHPVGDEVLKELGKLLKKLVSTSDAFAARNGGEQFAVLMPKAPPAIGLDMGEKIRSMIEKTDFPISSTEHINITVSIGVSSFPDNGTTLREIYGATNEAMFEAKATGRNRVFHYTNKKT